MNVIWTNNPNGITSLRFLSRIIRPLPRLPQLSTPRNSLTVMKRTAIPARCRSFMTTTLVTIRQGAAGLTAGF